MAVAIAGILLAVAAILFLRPSQALSSKEPEPNPQLENYIKVLLLGDTPKGGPIITPGESRAQQQEREAIEDREKAYAAGSVTEDERQTNREIAETLVVDFYGATQWPHFDKIVKVESNYNHRAKNKQTGACGLPQAHPCDKLPSFGSDEAIAIEAQVLWTIFYINELYGTPAKAAEHLNRMGWY